MGKIARLQGIAEEVKAEAEALEDRQTSHKKHVDGLLQFIGQFLITASGEPSTAIGPSNAAGGEQQARKFVRTFHTGAVSVPDSLPSPIKVSPFLLGIEQIFIADDAPHEGACRDAEGAELIHGERGGHDEVVHNRMITRGMSGDDWAGSNSQSESLAGILGRSR